MKKPYFWSHLVDTNTLLDDLEQLDLTSEQKKELMEIAHTHMHQTLMDAVLSQLSETDKRRFLELLAAGEDEKVWEHLNERVEKIEDKITLAAAQVKKELAEDIKKVKSA